MDELNIKPINNVDVEESGDAGIQICIVKCKGDTCDGKWQTVSIRNNSEKKAITFRSTKEESSTYYNYSI